MRYLQRQGFSLIELLVVMAIIAILGALVLPAVQKVRESSVRTRCFNNLKQMGIALHNYEVDNGSFPFGLDDSEENNNGIATNYYYYWSWMARIMPYSEQSNLYQEAVAFAQQGTYPWEYWDPFGFESGIPNPALATVNPLFVCTSDNRALQLLSISFPPQSLSAGLTSYLGVAGLSGFYQGDNSGMLVRDQVIQVQDVTDGLSNTVMVGERPLS